MASCITSPGPALLTKNLIDLDIIAMEQWCLKAAEAAYESQISLNEMEYSIFLAPKYSIQNFAVFSGRNCRIKGYHLYSGSTVEIACYGIKQFRHRQKQRREGVITVTAPAGDLQIQIYFAACPDIYF